MMAGTIDAFQSAGQTVPPISDGECQGGDLSWWLAHKATYKTVGGCFNGYQGAYVFFNDGAAHPGGQRSEAPDPRDPGPDRDEREHREVRHAGPAADLAARAGRPDHRVVLEHVPQLVLQQAGHARGPVAPVAPVSR